jgi:hypothetical protein
MSIKKQKKPPKLLPSKEYLEQCLDYDKLSGLLFWKNRPREHFDSERWFKSWHTKYAGKQACKLSFGDEYRKIYLDKERFLAHRVVYKMETGQDPEYIDHENGNTLDNSFKNLKNVSHPDNMQNKKKYSSNSSGYTGIYWEASKNTWLARIYKDGVKYYIGRYKNLNDAVSARQAAEKKLDFHPNHGR